MNTAATTNGTVNGNPSLIAALDYRARGFTPLPVPFKTKEPILDEWQNLRWQSDDELRLQFSQRCNVGILCGQPSGGLIDVDLDHPLAVELAPAYLPPTQAVFGRPGKPRSHFEYKATKTVATKKWKTPKSDGRKMIVELRSGGCQTVFPPSIHPSGETIAWDSDGEPAEIDPDVLKAQLSALSEEVHRRLGLTPNRPEGNGTLQSFIPGDDRILGWARNYISKIPGAVSGSGGHNTTFHVACVLVLGFALDRPQALALITEWNPKCDPPWRDDELAHKIDDALKREDRRGYLLNEFSRMSRRATSARPSRKIVIDANTGGSNEQLPISLPDLRSDDWRTDHSNAKRFAAMFGDRVRYAKESKDWFNYDGKQWRPGAELYVEALAKKIAEAIWNWFKPIVQKLDAREAVDILRFAKASSSARGISNILALARSEPDIGISIDRFDSQPYLLNCDNCVVDLKTGRALPHDRKLLLSKKTAAPYLQGPEAECPLWETTLDKIFRGNVATIGFLQRLLGCALVGEVVEHILAIFHGHGSNGKSLLIEILIAILGEYAHKAPADLLLVRNGEVHPTEKADLLGRRLVFCTETDAGRSLAPALTKELSGGDLVTARKMKQDFFTYKPTHTLFLCSNHKPRVADTGHGLWRRVRLVPFAVTFWDPDRGESGPPELQADKHLKEKLLAEAGGILAWLVRGCLEWQRIGLNEPDEVLNATKQYRAAEDVLAEFLRDTCMLGDEFEITAKELRAKYEEWCKSNGEKPVSGRRLGEYLSDKGINKRHSGGTIYSGIQTF
jgi:putative DNA primase/helicase